MKPLHAIAEDFRRVGVALIIAAIVGAFLQETVPAIVAISAAVAGAIANTVGYWLHGKEETP